MFLWFTLFLWFANYTFAYNISDIHRTTDFTEVYAWRDFYGQVPLDAINCGINDDKNNLYLGQTLYETMLIPGKIIEGNKAIYFEYFAVEHVQSTNIKILCSHQPEKLRWISTNNTEAANLAQSNILIVGGFEATCITYLGRVHPDNEVTNVGKVMCCKVNSCYGLYTTKNGIRTLYTEFDVLAYVEEKPTTVVKVSSSQDGSNSNRLSIDVIFD